MKFIIGVILVLTSTSHIFAQSSELSEATKIIASETNSQHFEKIVSKIADKTKEIRSLLNRTPHQIHSEMRANKFRGHNYYCQIINWNKVHSDNLLENIKIMKQNHKECLNMRLGNILLRLEIMANTLRVMDKDLLNSINIKALSHEYHSNPDRSIRVYKSLRDARLEQSIRYLQEQDPSSSNIAKLDAKLKPLLNHQSFVQEKLICSLESYINHLQDKEESYYPCVKKFLKTEHKSFRKLLDLED